MRKKRIIRIRGPRLRDIRDNLRLVLLSAKKAKWDKIFDEMKELSTDEFGGARSVRKMTDVQRSRYRELQRMESQLTDVANRSICKCFTCGRADRDMAYNPTYAAWYCIECYNMTRDFYKQVKQERKEKGISRADYDDFDEEYHKSFD